MCGIAGWIDWEQDLANQSEMIIKMSRTLANRGPDAEGIWLSPRAALGHRRLVVVDPEGGAQPMTRERGGHTYTIVYNGELYNTPDLKRELQARGCSFQTRNSDTEALLLAYMQWGPKCVEKLNGIFAFAIWDGKEQCLFLARDRMGVKPLFYTQTGSSFFFASELKALFAHPAVKPEIDSEGLAEILIMSPSRTPGHGVFRNIRELRPGYSLACGRNGFSIRKYWSLHSHPHEDDLDTTAAKVRQLLHDAVSRQLVADVPVCTLLSGGLDSSAITALASAEFKKNGLDALHSYSVDYLGNDEHFQASSFQPDADADWVGRVADYLKTEHHYIYIDNSQLADALIPALTANDMPGMADIDSSLYLFCREIKKAATVALSGECADEVFGGYPWFFDEQTLFADSFPWIRMVEERVRLLTPEIVKQIKPRQYLYDRYQEAVSEVPRLAGEAEHADRIRQLFYFNITRFMPTLLDRKDRMSMACGLEVRVPFSDHHLVEYVWNIPWEIKTCGQMAKGILRRALAGWLPPAVLSRRKSPYPKTHNPLYLSIMKKRVAQILADSSSPLFDLINASAVQKLMTSSGSIFPRPYFGQLMGEPQYLAYLIQLDTWLREYKVEIV